MNRPPSSFSMLLSRHTRRREFLAGLGGAVAGPLVARGQQPTIPVVGFLSPVSKETSRLLPGFLKGMADNGLVEGRNIVIDFRSAGGRFDLLPSLARELANRRPAVVVAGGATATAVAAKAATETIPIVFMLGSDPVQLGLVKSLARPSGNMTGVTLVDVELIPKEFQLIRDLVPSATTIALLINPGNPLISDALTKGALAAAAKLDTRVLLLKAGSRSEIDTAFTALVEQGANALVVSGDPLFSLARDQIVALAAQHAIPAICVFPDFAAAGGLVSYGTDPSDAGRLAGEYVARILKGERPADLPVQQITRTELIINLKTARALGLAIPAALLARADKVIE
jgi:putative tryptophan/tyrosine transport system substrate-binding protein